MKSTHLAEIAALAARSRLVELYYLKGVSEAELIPRTIEPYGLTQGKQDLMLRAYQIQPEEGWRYFMLHKVRRVADGGGDFKPRRRITIQSAVADESYGESDFWNDRRKRYRDHVSDSLADGRVTQGELDLLTGLQNELGLVLADIRFVHGSLYHRVLGAILQDGFIDREEVTELRLLHQLFHALGWCVGDK